MPTSTIKQSMKPCLDGGKMQRMNGTVSSLACLKAMENPKRLVAIITALEAVQLPEMGQIRALIGTMHCGVPTPMLAFPAPGFAAFVATLRMNFVAVPARCAFIAQTFANEKSGSTTRRNVEEFDDDSDDARLRLV